MALENISRAVLEAARTEAEHIDRAARLNAEEKVRAAREAAEQDAERRYQAAVRAVDEDFARKLIQLRGAANKELLGKKNARLREVFACAREKILAFAQVEYAKAMRKLLDGTAAGGGKVRIHPSDRDCFARLLDDYNKDRAADAQVTVDDAQTLPERGGFVFVSASYEVDRTLGTVLDDIERELAPAIAAELFGV